MLKTANGERIVLKTASAERKMLNTVLLVMEKIRLIAGRVMLKTASFSKDGSKDSIAEKIVLKTASAGRMMFKTTYYRKDGAKERMVLNCEYFCFRVRRTPRCTSSGR